GAKCGVAGGPDSASRDDGCVEPGGAVCPYGGRRGAGDRPAGDERPGLCGAARGGVRRSSIVKVRHAQQKLEPTDTLACLDLTIWIESGTLPPHVHMAWFTQRTR